MMRSECWREACPGPRCSRNRFSRSIRVKFFLNAQLSRLVHNRCIYSTFPLEACGGLDLRRVRAKWGLYNCEVRRSAEEARRADLLTEAVVDRVREQARCI